MSKFSPVSLLIPTLIGLLSTSIGLASYPAAPPSPAPSGSKDTGGTVVVQDARVRLTEGQLEVVESAMELPEAQPERTNPDHDVDLARRFAEALTTAPKTTKLRSGKRSAPTKPGVWTCGQWQDLWQGRGQGRTCEFK